MSVYAILDVEVHDEEKYAEYKRQVPPIIEKYGGRYVVRGAPIMAIGEWKPSRIVILEFPDRDKLQAFVSSPEYQPVLKIRNEATTSNTIVVEGYEPGSESGTGR